MWILVLLGVLGWMISRQKSFSSRIENLDSRVINLEAGLRKKRGPLLEVSPVLTEEPAELESSESSPEILEPIPSSPQEILTEELQPSKHWQMPAIDFENFMGVKLFAWLGGFALFLGMVFFVKYSIDHGWISPWVRVMIGFFVGAGAIAGGLKLRSKDYAMTVQTLCASGGTILYADIFACQSFYHFFSSGAAFGGMVLVTVISFLLAVRLDSKFIAILGLIGGFLTPPLLSTGLDRPYALFGYCLILDIGLVSIAVKKRWGFLMLMSALATYFMEWGWTVQFFHSDKIYLAVGIYGLFPLFYTITSRVSQRFNCEEPLFHVPAGFVSLGSMAFVAQMLTLHVLGLRPGVVLSFLLFLSLLLMYQAIYRDENRRLHMAGGTAAFFFLAWWTVQYLTPVLLPWGLAYILAFAVSHSAFPIILQKIRPTARPFLWGYAFGLLALVLMMLGILNREMISFLIWPFVFLIGFVVCVAAWIASLLWISAISLILTMSCFGIWIFQLSDVSSLSHLYIILGLFALAFFGWGLLVNQQWNFRKKDTRESQETGLNSMVAKHLPSLSALSPFFLLALTSCQLPVQNPSLIFALMFALNILLLGLAAFRIADVIPLIALGATVGVQMVWHTHHFNQALVWPPLGWYLTFYILFTIFPFLFQKKLQGKISWLASAISGPLHFFLIYDAISKTFGKTYIGLVPAGFAVISLLSLYGIPKWIDTQSLKRSLQACFGGVALFFITLIIPLQFDKEWITLGWTLEGAALLWLYHRVKHSGLQVWGLGLLFISFARLTLNPAILSYHPRAVWPILNWYLYVYGTAVLCFLAASKSIMSGPASLWFRKRIPGLLKGLGAVLAFLLLNIEIADFFSKGSTITFQFSANLAQDMTYSLGWALFAFTLLLIGIGQKNQGARFGSLILLTVTILKVFLHDLWRLGQLYRVASIIGLAAVLILVSFLYQRYLKGEKKYA